MRSDIAFVTTQRVECVASHCRRRPTRLRSVSYVERRKATTAGKLASSGIALRGFWLTEYYQIDAVTRAANASVIQSRALIRQTRYSILLNGLHGKLE